MTEKSTKPQLRFAGFDDTWEQRKLDTITDVRDGTHDSPQYVETGHPFITSKNVKDGFINYEDIQYVSDKDYEEINKRSKVDKNDILMGMIGTIGNIALVRETPDFAIKNVALIKDIGDVHYRYLYHCLQSNSVAHQLDENLDGGTQKFIALNKIRELVIPVPSEHEQHKIGDYMESLDNLITLHQRKYDKLTNVKKSMLEKMFPKNGSNVPEIRFKGFSDAWEQRKLSDIADKVTEKNGGLQYIETFTNSAEYGIISQRDYFDHDIAKIGSLDGYYIVRNEDFVYNPRISTSAPVGPINRNKLGRTGVMSPLYTVFRPHDVDTTYLEHFFKSKYWHSFMNFNGDSGARSDRFSIKDSVFFEMPVPIPHIEEQRKIGECLTNIDNLITLHQRELEKLKNLKKACLEKMFV